MSNGGGFGIYTTKSSGGGGGSNTIYNANDTIGSGRVATLTDTLTFDSGEVRLTEIATASQLLSVSMGTYANINDVVASFSFNGTSGVGGRTALYCENNISGGATNQVGLKTLVTGWSVGVETASIVAENGGNNLTLPTNSDVALLSGFALSASNKNATSYGIYCTNTNRAATTNYGAYIEASSSANNYALVVPFSGGNVGFGTTTPDASAILDLNTNQQGFLPPRMSTTEMNTISSPADGLIVFDRTTQQWMGYNGIGWVILG
jgi:hypothetical protein